MAKPKLPPSPSKLLAKALEIISEDLEALSKLPSPRDDKAMAAVERYSRMLHTLALATDEAATEARAKLARLTPQELAKELEAAKADLVGGAHHG